MRPSLSRPALRAAALSVVTNRAGMSNSTVRPSRSKVTGRTLPIDASTNPIW
jgi:hypothetical protein